VPAVLGRARADLAAPIRAFLEAGIDLVTGNSIAELAAKMNALAGNELIDRPQLQAMITARDAQLANRLARTHNWLRLTQPANIEVTG